MLHIVCNTTALKYILIRLIITNHFRFSLNLICNPGKIMRDSSVSVVKLIGFNDYFYYFLHIFSGRGLTMTVT